METTTVPDYPRGVTFEEVWALVKENSLHQKETDRLQKEAEVRAKESEARAKEAALRMEKLEKIVKRNSRQMGDLHTRFGEIAEHLVAPGIHKRFNELGFKFDSILPGGRKIIDENGRIRAQVDLVLENGEHIVAIEVKVKPDIDDVNDHIKRLGILREYWDKRNDRRKLLGGIAGAIFPQNVRDEALKAGLYVIVQSGDTMKMELSDNFVPREWLST